MDLEVSRQDLHRVAVHDHPPAELTEGQARLRVDAFALTTNNITYAVFGDALKYWSSSGHPHPGRGRGRPELGPGPGVGLRRGGRVTVARGHRR
jgi:hypothetical protein